MKFDYEELAHSIIRLAQMQEEKPAINITSVMLGVKPMPGARMECNKNSVLLVLATGKAGQAILEGLCGATPHTIDIVEREEF